MRKVFRLGLPLVIAMSSCAGDEGVLARRASVTVQPVPREVSPLLALGAVALASDDHGAPTLVRALRTIPAPAGTSRADAARAHVVRLAPGYLVRAVPTLTEKADLALPGGAHIVSLAQEIGGVPVLDGTLRVLVREDGSLFAIGGRLVDASRVSRATFTLDAEQALASAAHARLGTRIAPTAGMEIGGWTSLAAPGVSRARARRARVLRNGALEPVYQVELWSAAASGATSRAWQVRVHASTGEILATRELTSHDATTYSVFAGTDGVPLAGPYFDLHPHPTGLPDGTEPDLILPRTVTIETMKSLPTGEIDPWRSGSPFTLGNNAAAYADVDGVNGFSEGDMYGEGTATSLEHVYDPTLGPRDGTVQRMAALTQLFYTINYMHDVWYDAGFDEAHGNGQLSNFGRGGEANDPLLLEAEDRNDFMGVRPMSITVPEDGSSARLEANLYTHRRTLFVVGAAPEPSLRTGWANFGPGAFDETGELAIVNDGTSPTTDACEPITNMVAGKIVLIDRTVHCPLTTQAMNAQEAGARGVIVMETTPGADPPVYSGSGDDLHIGILTVTLSDGSALSSRLAEGPVTVRMRSGARGRDPALDATLVQHEFAHFLHDRLTQCWSSRQCFAMAEGWGDVLALHAQLREEDDPSGAYAIGTYAVLDDIDSAYYGVRRVPYSTSPSRNALSFRHIGADASLPTHPMRKSAEPNSEIHNAGEVWTSAVFEAYGALLEHRPYATARSRFASYVVAGLLMAPENATFTEARDGLLVAIEAVDGEDALSVAEAFARRGLGSCATAPERTSEDMVGVIEGTTVAPAVTVADVRIEVDDAHGRDCDDDGVLDAGERGTVVVTLVNTGLVPASTSVSVTPTVEDLVLGGAGGPVTVPARGELEVTFSATLDEGLGGSLPITLAVRATTPTACTPLAEYAETFRVDRDDHPQTSSTATFEATEIDFTFTGEHADEIWRKQVDAEGNGAIVGVNYDGSSDTALVSPPFVVGTGAPFVLSFEHRHSFETSVFEGQDPFYWDGARIEYSVDDGESWTDIDTLGDAGYGGPRWTEEGDPFEHGDVYRGRNPSYPAMDAVTIDCGTQLAGETVRLRFRIATDEIAGDEGWTIDDVTLSGIVGTPFTAVTDDATTCPVEEPDAGVTEPDAGTDAGVTEDGGTIDAGVMEDGGVIADAGDGSVTTDAAEPPDAMTEEDAGMLPDGGHDVKKGGCASSGGRRGPGGAAGTMVFMLVLVAALRRRSA